MCISSLLNSFDAPNVLTICVKSNSDYEDICEIITDALIFKINLVL